MFDDIMEDVYYDEITCKPVRKVIWCISVPTAKVVARYVVYIYIYLFIYVHALLMDLTNPLHMGGHQGSLV